MDEWTVEPLDACLESLIDYRGKSPPKSPHGIPVLSAKVIKGGQIVTPIEQRISEQDYGAWMRRGTPQAGDVVLTTEGPLGELAVLDDGVYAPGQRVVFLRGKSDKLLSKYLFYYLASSVGQSELHRFATGTTVAGISQASLRKVPIRFPRYDYQLDISDLLGSLDAKIELSRRMARTLEEIARMLFRSWFVDFDPVRAKTEGRDPALPTGISDLFPSRFGDDGLPDGWATLPLGDIVQTLETGSRPKGGVAEYSGGVPSIGAESIIGLGIFDFTKTKYVPEEFFAAMRRGVCEDMDVLLYKDGGKPGDFRPHVALFGAGFPFERYAINEHVYRIRSKMPFSQEFLFLHLSSEITMIEMRQKGTGVAIPGLNSTAARSLEIIDPGKPLLVVFSDLVRPLIRRALTLSNESRTLAVLRDALLPKLISGEMRIPDAEALVEKAA